MPLSESRLTYCFNFYEKDNFVIRFDKQRNSTRLFSNGIITVKVKYHLSGDMKDLYIYNIIDVKTGLILKTMACISYNSMLKT